MCGIIATYGNTSNEISLNCLNEISHRGNAHQEYQKRDKVFLGTNRLPIQGRKDGSQPFHNENETVFAIQNGEIYNTQHLHQQLTNQGHTISTDCDTELLCHLYEQYQEEMISHIDSEMFAFVIYDQPQEKLLMARDRIGVKPLYYAQDTSGNRYFASELKALSGNQQIEQIHTFPPGHYARLQDQKLSLHCYYKTPKVNPTIKESNAVKKIRTLFDQAVQKRVQTDLPIGVYMSGGIDSTSVLATACKYHDNVTAIIVGKQDSEDRQVATKYCQEYNIPYIVESPPSEEQLFEQIEQIVRICESFEPNMIRQSAVSYHIAQTASHHGFKIVLCGEGADEVFAGYPEFGLLPSRLIDQKISQFVNDLHRTQLQRVDRTSMHFTTEVRCPFLDTTLMKHSLQIPASLKIKHQKHHTISKYILRKAMQDRLPAYIYNRTKVVLSEGAGYKGNEPKGLFNHLASTKVSDQQIKTYQQKYPAWSLQTKEEVYYFQYFLKHNYQKLADTTQRTIVNKISSKPQYANIARKIFDILLSWKYKRQQAYNERILFERILSSIEQYKPIHIVMYRGKGDRVQTENKERNAISLLSQLYQSIILHHPHGVQCTIVYTDTHIQLNNYPQKSSQQYRASLEKLTKPHERITINNMSEYCPLISYHHANNQTQTSNFQTISGLLQHSAQKHYQGNMSIKNIARWYFVQNQKEKVEINKHFPDAIFLTYNDDRFNSLFPIQMPILYYYSTKKGCSEKPWF